MSASSEIYVEDFRIVNTDSVLPDRRNTEYINHATVIPDYSIETIYYLRIALKINLPMFYLTITLYLQALLYLLLVFKETLPGSMGLPAKPDD